MRYAAQADLAGSFAINDICKIIFRSAGRGDDCVAFVKTQRPH
jgi:hypothetical protein